MNSYGHSLTTSTSISAPEQILDFSYKNAAAEESTGTILFGAGRF